MQGEVENVNWQKSNVSPSQFRKRVYVGIEFSETDSSLAIHALACTFWKVCTGVVALHFPNCSYEAT